MAKQTGHRWSVSFQTSGLSFSFISITPPQPSRGSIDFSDLSTEDWSEFNPADLADGGELTFTGYFEGKDPGANLVTGDPETFRVYFGDSATSGTVFWEFAGFVTAFAPQQGQSNQRAEVQVTIKVDGAITRNTVT